MSISPKPSDNQPDQKDWECPICFEGREAEREIVETACEIITTNNETESALHLFHRSCAKKTMTWPSLQ